MTYILEIENLSKRLKKKSVLRDINLKVKKGEVIALKGPSGSGKSTLLKIISGIVSPDLGNINVAGRPIGYIFQEPRLLPWFNALENIAIPLISKGETKRDAQKKAKEYLFKTGLLGFEKNYPHELSGGMNQRVSIARALAIEPKLILLDEPFTGLDPLLRSSVKELIEKNLESTGAGAILVTHNNDEILSSVKEVYSLNKGSLLRG